MKISPHPRFLKNYGLLHIITQMKQNKEPNFDHPHTFEYLYSNL